VFIFQAAIVILRITQSLRHHETSGLEVARFAAFVYVPPYALVAIYFFRSSFAVLSSIKPSSGTTSAGVRTRRLMSLYVFGSGMFMLLNFGSSIIFLTLTLTPNSKLTEVQSGVIFLLYYVARAGTALCSVAIFHVDSRAPGFSKGGRKNYPTVFLESENVRLAEQLRVQRDTEESKLKKERDFVASALHEIR